MALLAINAGSSSLKFGLYADANGAPEKIARGAFTGLGEQPRFSARDREDATIAQCESTAANHEQAIGWLLEWLEATFPEQSIDAAGHRIVHGGRHFSTPVKIDAATLQALRQLVPLAPLHLPHNLAAVEALQRYQPELPQVACFDTAFHHDMPFVEQTCALPRDWFARGVRRYGFHGLSYEYIASVLPAHLGDRADGRVIVAHLGHGASLCALSRRRSMATTMGFTPLDGIPMATRPGHLDPGVLLYLLREEGMTLEALDDLLNHHSGLAGLSGGSGDMRELLDDDHPEAQQAIDYFVHHVGRAIASLAAVLGGIDALVFTAGIGENASAVRAAICRSAAWLGIDIDAAANAATKTRISSPDSAVSVWVIPTNEEITIARQVIATLREAA